MTGVGLAQGPTEVGELRVEVRSINARTFAPKLRLPSACWGFETAIEEAVQRGIARGSVTVTFEHRGPTGGGPDRDALVRANTELQELAREGRLPAPTFADVVAWVQANTPKEVATSRPLPPQVAALLANALAELDRHRRGEGRATAGAIERDLLEFETLLAAAAARAPQLVDGYRERLLQRVQEFVAQHSPGPLPAADVVREVALFADRVDVAEEVQRLAAHLVEFRNWLARDEVIGRRLEFLLQEFLRETNTLGSKSPDTAMAHTVVAMKSCIERLKEQVANLE
ncbi:MAG: DUF1732 domain-containing protein [Planctomycetota bacterium]